MSDALLDTVARVRFQCGTVGHPLAHAPHNADLWIAATAIHIKATLATTDRVFADTPGLQLF